MDRAVIAAALAASLLACGKSQSQPEPPPPPGDRTVTGTYATVYWTDDGVRTTVAAAPSILGTPRPGLPTYSAHVPTASGYDVRPGSVDGAGRLSIPGVPAGRYFLVQEGKPLLLEEHEADALDLSTHRQGRADALVPPFFPAPVDVSLTGLSPWDGVHDVLTLVSSNAGLWFSPWGTMYGGAALADGATAAAGTLDFTATIAGPQPVPDGAKADVVYVGQLASGSGTSVVPLVLTRLARLSGASVTRSAVAGALAAVPLTGSMPVEIRLSEFEALASQVGPSATPQGGAVWVESVAHPLAFPGPTGGTIDQVILDALPGQAATVRGTVAFGQLQDPLWHEVRGHYFGFTVAYQVGTATSARARVAVGGTGPFGPNVSPVLAPRLTPAQSPTVAERDAFQAQAGVGTTPLIAWTAPAVGSPTLYDLTVYQLLASAGRSSRTPVLRAQLKGDTRRFSVPPDVLTAGLPYHVVITARRLDTGGISEPPRARPVSEDRADCITAPFTP